MELFYQNITNKNKYVDIDFNLSEPLIKKELVLEDGSCSDITLHGSVNNLLIFSYDNKLVCFDCDKLTMLWKFDCGDTTWISPYLDGSNLFVDTDYYVYKIDFVTKKVINKGEYGHNLKLLSDDYIYLVDYSSDNEKVIIKNKNNKNTFSKSIDIENIREMVNELGKTVIVTTLDILCYSEKNKEILWRYTIRDFLRNKCSDNYNLWLSDYASKELNQGDEENISIGLISDNIIYLTSNIGIVFAVDVNTVDIIWVWEFPEKNDRTIFQSAKTIIKKDNIVYLHENQHHSHVSYLYAISILNGETLNISNKTITPSGCNNAIVIGNYFIGGNENFLSCWDLRSFEQKWLHKNEKNKIFWGAPAILEDKIIYADLELCQIEIYSSKDS